MPNKSKVTQLLLELQNHSGEAYEELFPLVYAEMKCLAYSQLQQERDDITLTGTALVHEVYMKMVKQESIKANDKNHFLAICARCMRQLLVDHARKKQAEKRGGAQQNITYIDELMKTQHKKEELINLDEKLKELATFDERMAQVVTLRYFGEMTIEATANVLGVSPRTVKRDWTKARGWLYKELKG